MLVALLQSALASISAARAPRSTSVLLGFLVSAALITEGSTCSSLYFLDLTYSLHNDMSKAVLGLYEEKVPYFVSSPQDDTN